MKEEEVIKQFNEEYGEIGDEFRKIQKQQYDLFMRKMLSYGKNNISLGSNLSREEDIRLSLTGIWIRCRDKMERIKQLVLNKGKNPLADEPVDDAYIDMSNYSIIALIVKNGKWK